ncbi:GNAT family N-acetyltransferase [Kineothrix sp. MSJ-39]|uniref:GNAT family N-acetyltransferase n=1 Tax=Kineothrix sp. MSJ-39 TaxID=2841533 RepID=UPI001C11D1F5|nr:GNAT family N-acetyltransferase [Kineothrix sp. MSJ-39]MBU5430728.1 GNAT family N-acetyltransferase [Kineothrix sp. MSJ-39]
MIKIRKAEKNDLDRIEQIYDRIHDEEEKGVTTTGWIRNIYPTRKTAEEALDRNDLFVMTDEDNIVAAAVINQIQVDEYKYAEWKHHAKDTEVMVLHGLAVDPFEKGKGYGRAFIAYYENYARQSGCAALRMDTNARNTRARSLYQKLGYKEKGIVKCVFNGIPNVQLVCFEKYAGEA